MSRSRTGHGCSCPASLEAQLLDFRRRVWTIKSIEAVGGAVFGVVRRLPGGLLLDRVLDTPAWLRLAIFLRGAVGCALAAALSPPLDLAAADARSTRPPAQPPLSQHRRPDAGHHRAGAQRLRAAPLAGPVRGGHRPGRRGSRSSATFSDAVPTPRHRLWVWLAAASRRRSPSRCWRSIPRRRSMPGRGSSRPGGTSALHVRDDRAAARAAGRAARRGRDDSRSLAEGLALAAGARARVQVGGSQQPLAAPLKDGSYEFACRRRSTPARCSCKIGDVREQRAPGADAAARAGERRGQREAARIPGAAKPLEKDVRGGTVSLVKGSVATFTATANRKLAQATIDEQPAAAERRGSWPARRNRSKPRASWSSSGRTSTA